MRARYEFAFYETSGSGVRRAVDPALGLMGAQGWEIRGVTALGVDALLVALQRPLDEQPQLPDAPTLAASLEQPLLAPDLT